MGTLSLPAGLAERISERAETFAAWMEKRGAWFVAVFTAIYFPVTIVLARGRPFWYDELFTYYIATIPDLPKIWQMLAAGIDHHPPEFFLLTRAAASLPFSPNISFRLPEIVGIWLACVCVFFFVRLRTNVLYGAAAALLPIVLGTLWFAIDARPYGLMLGFSALALLAWQLAGSGPHRRVARLVLALACSAAVCSHYYSVLLFAALGAGEAVRSLERRRVDRLVWLALLAGIATAAAHLPLVVSSIDGFGKRNWASPYATVSIDIYRRLAVEISEPLLACLILTAIWLALDLRPSRVPQSPGTLSLSETVAACVMLAGSLCWGTRLPCWFQTRSLIPTSLDLFSALRFLPCT